MRRGKGGKDRVTMFTEIARAGMEAPLVRVRALHARDVREGAGAVARPTALDRKAPGWAVEPAWPWAFPLGSTVPRRREWGGTPAPRSRDGDATCDAAGGSSGGDHEARHVSHATALVRDASIMEDGYDIRTLQDCWGIRM